ncbi:pectate lyase, partial [Clavibacter nebraskensis]
SADSGSGSAATGAGPTARVASVAALRDAIAQHVHHIVITTSLYGGTSPVYVDVLDSASSGTVIEGATPTVELVNIQLRIFDLTYAGAIHDVTVRDLTMHGRIQDLVALTGAATKPYGVGVNYEAISVRGAAHVTIDHIVAYDTTDDLMSVTRGADDVTISNSTFSYSRAYADIDPSITWDWGFGLQPLASERLGILVGANAKDSYAVTGHLHVNLVDDHIGPLVRGRPLLRGDVDVKGVTFDNTQAGSEQYAAIEVGSGGRVVVEGCEFDHSNNPIAIHLDSPSDTYALFEGGNTFIATTGTIAKGQPLPPRAGAARS